MCGGGGGGEGGGGVAKTDGDEAETDDAFAHWCICCVVYFQ